MCNDGLLPVPVTVAFRQLVICVHKFPMTPHGLRTKQKLHYGVGQQIYFANCNIVAQT